MKEVSLFANSLKSLGVKKGDRVCLYMQMIPELAIAVLACARIGAVHSVVFGAFSSDSLRDRINDSKCKILVTQDTGVRGTKQNIPMKENADKAVMETPSIQQVIVVKRTGEKYRWTLNWIFGGTRPSGEPDLQARNDGCRGSLIYTLHFRFYWKTKRSLAHNWWLFGLCIFYT